SAEDSMNRPSTFIRPSVTLIAVCTVLCLALALPLNGQNSQGTILRRGEPGGDGNLQFADGANRQCDFRRSDFEQAHRGPTHIWPRFHKPAPHSGWRDGSAREFNLILGATWLEQRFQLGQRQRRTYRIGQLSGGRCLR